MHGLIVSTLTENQILALFIVIGLGYALGEAGGNDHLLQCASGHLLAPG